MADTLSPSEREAAIGVLEQALSKHTRDPRFPYGHFYSSDCPACTWRRRAASVLAMLKKGRET